MPCPHCKDSRVTHSSSNEELKKLGYTEWYLDIDENTNPDVKFCPYCGTSLIKKEYVCNNCQDRKQWYSEDNGQVITCKYCYRQNLCLHCLENGYWKDEDKCPACAKKGHTSPWQVSECEQCQEDFFDIMQKNHNVFEHHPSSKYISRKVIKALGVGNGSANDIQNRIVQSGFNVIIADVRAAICELIENKVVKVNKEGLYELCDV